MRRRRARVWAAFVVSATLAALLQVVGAGAGAGLARADLAPARPAGPTLVPQPTPSPSPASRAVTLTSSSTKVIAGQSVELSGRVTSADAACRDDETVHIGRRVHGSDATSDTPATSDSDGAFSRSLSVQVSADYVASVRAHDNCPAVESEHVAVLVRVRVGARASATQVPKGSKVAISGAVQPSHPASEVLLERRKDREWVVIRRGSLSDDSTFKFTVRARWAKRAFRARWEAQDEDHVAGRSSRIVVRSSARR